MKENNLTNIIEYQNKINDMKKMFIIEHGLKKVEELKFDNYTDCCWTIDNNTLIYLNHYNQIKSINFDYILKKDVDENIMIFDIENNLVYDSDKKHICFFECVNEHHYDHMDNYIKSEFNIVIFSTDNHKTIKEIENLYYDNLDKKSISLFQSKMFEYMIEKDVCSKEIPEPISYSEFEKECKLSTVYKIQKEYKNSSYHEFLKEFKGSTYDSNLDYDRLRNQRENEAVFLNQIKDMSHEDIMKIHTEVQNKIKKEEDEKKELQKRVMERVSNNDLEDDLPF